jgi:hypothetical protein
LLPAIAYDWSSYEKGLLSELGLPVTVVFFGRFDGPLLEGSQRALVVHRNRGNEHSNKEPPMATHEINTVGFDHHGLVCECGAGPLSGGKEKL